MDTLLAIDGGGSRTRCRVITRAGQMLGAGESGPSNHLLVAREVVSASLNEAIDAALAQSGLERSHVVCVSAGLAGVDYDGTGADEMKDLLRALGMPRTVINGDMVIAHTGALNGSPGVLALAGTGSVILGIGPTGQRVKIGGWGPVFGDEGSAYRIGQQALRAAAKAYDGRGRKTTLVDALTLALGANEFRGTLQRVYIEKMESRQLAALAKVVSDAARAGDVVARDIFLEAGDELAESVAAAISRLNFGETRTLVSYQGSTLESCELLRERLIESLQKRFPKASLVPPLFSPVIGAFLLGCQALTWRLDESVFNTLRAAQPN